MFEIYYMYLSFSDSQGILDEDQQVYSCLKVEFLDNTNSGDSSDLKQRLEKLWSTGITVILWPI